MSSDRPNDGAELLSLLHELTRLEPDLVVRDLSADAALGTLTALAGELVGILQRAAERRREIRSVLAGLEHALDATWGTGSAADQLRQLALLRRELAELDAALGPCQLLNEELDRRCSRRVKGKADTQEDSRQDSKDRDR